MKRQRGRGLCAVALLGAVVTGVACQAGLAKQETEGFTIKLLTDTSVQVGQQPIAVEIVPAGPEPAGDLGVLFHYYPFVYRVKDSLAAPDEVVRVVPAVASSEGYRATLELDRPGPWKVAVRIAQPGRPDSIVYFTLDVKQSGGAGKH